MEHSYDSKYIAGLYRQSKIDINSQFERFGVRPTEGDIMLFLSDNPGLSQHEVAAMMVLDAGIVTRYIKNLDAKGLVIRTVSTQDARQRTLKLSMKGTVVVQQLRQILNNWWTNLFADAAIADGSRIEREVAALYQTVIERNQAREANKKVKANN